MGYRNTPGDAPSSPASRWLRRVDQHQKEEAEAAATYVDDYAMDMEYEANNRSAAVSPKTVMTPRQRHRHGVDCEMLASGAGMQQRQPNDIDEAIEMASPRALRKLLRMMVHSQQSSMDLATAYLMPAPMLTHSGMAPVSGKSSRKRKMYETCQHCRMDFEPGNNREERCSYHPGDKVMIPYGFAYAQNGDGMFQWTCCNQIGTAVGCVWGRHLSAASGRIQRPWEP
ncbi:hypothetical protein CKM354_001220600 [Cercospora kikuchii]|uniref:C2H2-type domain-containing protein n=1 Tax=Cercospora kikuchii TaxID=84275 RepID=A0A9P3FLJ3_9PEZI|nr:uncharacterized protein CKM354_001220600 [Cercospora kikuchii]GIZ49171.1 hypothetical protein CKM354_001220600 [Cercospora kikuchii]